VLRRVFEPEREEFAGGWRKLHNEKLHNLYASRNIIRLFKSRRMRWMVNVVCMREMRNAYKIMVRKHEGERPLRRPRHGWEDNIRMDIGWEGVDWMHVAEDRDQWQTLVNMRVNLQFP